MSSHLSEKVDYLLKENSYLKASKLQFVRLLLNSKQLTKHLQQQLHSNTISGCNCQFTSSRRPHSNEIRGNPQIKNSDVEEAQSKYQRLMELFILENDWLHQYIRQLEQELEKISAEVEICRIQLMLQAQESEMFVIKELSEKIQELTRQQGIPQRNDRHLFPYNPDGDLGHSTKFSINLELMNQVQTFKDISIKLSIRNDMLAKQNNSLMVLNSILGSQLRKKTSFQQEPAKVGSPCQKGDEEYIKLVEAQKKALKLSLNSIEDSAARLSSQSAASDDYDFFVYSNRVQKKTQGPKPDALPTLDIQKAQLMQQIQLKKQQEQQEKQERLDVSQNQQKKQQSSGSNFQGGHGSIIRSDDQSGYIAEQFKEQTEQLHTELVITKKELESVRQQLIKFQNLYTIETHQKQILTEQLKKQSKYLDGILQTNDTLIQAYKNLEQQLIKVRNEKQINSRAQIVIKDGKLRLDEIHQHFIEEDSENLYDEIEQHVRERSKSSEQISFPIKEYIKLFHHQSKRRFSQHLFRTSKPLRLNKQNRQQSQENHFLMSQENNTSSVNQTEGFDEFMCQITNRTKLKYYSLEKGNQKANIYFQQ